MATSTQSPNDLTRQQLDELDDLLQRMLSLPLNPPEPFAPTPPAQAYTPPMPTPAPAPVAREVPVAAPAPRVFTPPAPEPQESPFVFTPTPAPAPVVAPATRPEPAPISAPMIERPAPAVSRPATVIEKPRPSPGEPVPFLYAPFVVFNAVLNWTLGLFGFPGRVLRSGFVKSLFGLAGIGLLAYTGLKVAQIHGLVSLPQELPWPPR
jgi:hypothetical protein